MKNCVKKFGIVLICFIMLFMITGCGNKTAITASDFKTKMESKGYILQDVISQFSDYNYFNQAYVALSFDSAYQIEFYELSDTDSAISFFNTNKDIFEKSKSSGSSETSVSIGNNEKYTLTTNSKFKVLSRIDNTVIYLDVSEDYKSQVKDILKDLGY